MYSSILYLMAALNSYVYKNLNLTMFLQTIKVLYTKFYKHIKCNERYIIVKIYI